MRISDWSSDVCSSDLRDQRRWHRHADRAVPFRFVERCEADDRRAFGEAVAFGQTDAGDLLPAFCDGLLHGGAAADRELEFAEIEQIGRASCRERVCQYV